MDTRSMHRNRPFSILADDPRVVEVLRSFYGFSEATAKELIQELPDVTSLQSLAGYRVARVRRPHRQKVCRLAVPRLPKGEQGAAVCGNRAASRGEPQNLIEKEILMRINPNELRGQRYDHFTAADTLIRAAKKTGKDLAGAELEEFEAHVQEIKNIDHKFDLYDKACKEDGLALIARDLTMPGGAPAEREDERRANLNLGALFGSQPVPQSSGWADPRTGAPVAVLKPEQRMSDLAVDFTHEPPLSLGAYVRGVITGKWNGAERELRAMSEGSLGGGGYLLPSPLSAQIIDKVRNAAVMLKAGALTVPMDTATLAMARVAGDVTPAWHSEAAAITASDMSFERVTFTAQTLAALAVMSVELFEDVTNLDSIVTSAIAKVLALELDRAGLRGSGTAPEPKGIRNQTNVVIDSTTFTANGSVISAAAPTGAVAWDWLAKQVSSIWGVNENPNAAIYSARTAGELDLLRATTGEVLGPPNSVANLNRLFTNAIPNNLTQGSANDCSEAYVGDFTQALIGMRREVVLEFSRQANVGATSLFSTMQVGIRAYLRADFQLARPAAFRVVTGIR